MDGFNDVLNRIDEELQPLQEMARIGNVGNYEIFVYSGECSIPHFHFKNAKTGEEGCLKILESDYFKHGKYQAELNSKERKEIFNFLKDNARDEIYAVLLNLPGRTKIKTYF